MNKKIIVKPGQVISIEILRNKGTGPRSGVLDAGMSGMVPAAKTEDYLPRRLQPTGIRFFDVVIKDDEQLFLTHIVEPEVQETSFLDISMGFLETADYTALLEQIYEYVFDVPLNEWATRFKLLRETDDLLGDVFVKYTDDVNGPIQSSIGGWLNDFEKFRDDALELSSQDEVNSLEIKGLFDYYGDKYVKLSNLPVDIKVTEENDANADAVEFVPSKQMDIFLFPSIVSVLGETEYHNGLHDYVDGSMVHHTDTVQYLDFLNGGYQVLNREWFPVWKNTLGLDLYDQYYAYWQIHKEYPGAVMKRGKRDFYEVPPYDYYNLYTDEAPADFPYAPLYTGTGIEEDTYLTDEGIGHQILSVSNRTTRLIWVIKKGSKYYYFWDIVT